MRRRRTLPLILWAVVSGAASAGAWLSTPNLAPGGFGGGVTEMLVRADGDVVATSDGDAEADGAVVRFAADTGAVTLLPFAGVCRRPEAVAQLPSGDVVVAGARNGDCDDDPGLFTVMRIDDATNALRWTHDVQGRSRAVVTGPDDMLVAAGRRWDEDGPDTTFDVVRLHPSTGRPLWKFRTLGSTAEALALDPDGHVVAGGSLPTAYDAFGIVKIDGATGTFVWRDQVGTAGVVRLLAVDATGAVVAAGHSPGGPGWHTRVAKVAGDDGALAWTRTWSSDDIRPVALTLAPSGDPIVAGSVCDPDCRWIVERLAAADGTTAWSLQTVIAGGPRGIARAANGDVLVTGQSPGGMTTLRLAETDGAVRWRSELEPYCTSAPTPSAGDTVGERPDGDVAVGGSACVDPALTRRAMLVVTLRGEDGTLVPVPTTVPTSTTTTTIPPSACTQLRHAGCMDGVTPKPIRRKLAKLCEGDPAPPSIRRRLASRIARLARRGRLSATCAKAVALHHGS